jgi:hypothetical protein
MSRAAPTGPSYRKAIHARRDDGDVFLNVAVVIDVSNVTRGLTR